MVQQSNRIGEVDDGNSSQAQLAGAGVFTGAWRDAVGFADISAYARSSVISAVGGFVIQQSADGVNVHITDVYTVPAGGQANVSLAVRLRFVRIVYTNGAGATSNLVISMLLARTYKKASSVKPADGRSTEQDMEESISYQAALNSQTGTFDLARSAPGGSLLAFPYTGPENSWQYASAAGGIINTTDVVIKAAGAAGVRNYVTGMTLQNGSAVATEVVVKDGATVIWRGFLGASSSATSEMELTFATPLRGSAATALNVACITTASAIYVNAQGFTMAG